LALRDGAGGLIAKCFAGCDAGDVLGDLRRRGLLDNLPYDRPHRRSSPASMITIPGPAGSRSRGGFGQAP